MKKPPAVRFRQLKRDTLALYLAARDPRTPTLAKIIAVIVTAYAFSPIDLIPDFIPVIGYLDDAVIVPAGLWLAVTLIPEEVWSECQREADARFQGFKRKSWLAGAVVIAVWLAAIALLVVWAQRLLAS